jgi:hypothetical protein
MSAMTTGVMLLLVYAFFLTLDFLVIFGLVMAVRFGSGVPGPKMTVRRKWPKDGAAELRLRMEDLREAAGPLFLKRAVTDGRTLIAVKDRLSSARVTVRLEGGTMVLECAPGKLHFIRIAMIMLLFSFFLGPLALVILYASIRGNRRFSSQLFRLAERTVRPRGRKDKGKTKKENGKKAGERKGPRKRKSTVGAKGRVSKGRE